MAFYRDHVYPRIVDVLGDPEPIRKIRRRIVPLAHGEVLEIGAGSGANFPHYDPAKVNKVFALEPNSGMVRLAERRRGLARVEIEFLGLPGERIPLADASVDAVVSTFTMCTIPGVLEAIQGVARVLRPRGRLIFFEHGLAPDSKMQRWQRLSEPVTRCLFEGCHVTRDIPLLIRHGGFRIEQIESAYMGEYLKSWAYCWWGVAVPQ